ncbi:undecaprenyl-diphosphatase [Modicisalibacter ilicicola DSM 19980]|uniref:undecaprenyl-diphosphate phosphatase n=1 Tax=Modicisalibacter ilicicola DSM 19980 TaxID=1121942 RepID=A0A1M4X9M1_9GAMM|nr:phosphatase PAP2 family protein [Halomonas ilicicola]SHE90209.1 undecaprenyl-diphosphatase [Halomonas ilicicola DSM 19980]
MLNRTPPVFERLDLIEWQLCHRVATFSHYRPLLMTLRVASRLGDWPAWLLLTLALPWLHGKAGWNLALQFIVTAAIGAGVYRLLKTRLCRERPFITFTAIPCTMPPLDRYSFPSGHTLHAVSFCTLTAATTPWLLFVVAPLMALIAMSRIGLGLHYVTDVVAGAMLGLLLAQASLAWWPMVMQPA